MFVKSIAACIPIYLISFIEKKTKGQLAANIVEENTNKNDQTNADG